MQAVFVTAAPWQCFQTPPGASPLEAIVVGSAPEATSTSGARVTSFDEASRFSGAAPAARSGRSDLAYILYTSGSTGMPKGVMLSHENALSFVDWCSSVFQPTEHDRFSSHAPFHFDLSVLDIYSRSSTARRCILISEDLGKNPKELARFIAEHRLTVWYSTPSILTLLLQFGELDAHDVSELCGSCSLPARCFRSSICAQLQRCWPRPDYYNLYGPTETNVCTFARIPRVPDDRDVPYPIGFACAHCEALVLDDEGREVPTGGEGLLLHQRARLCFRATGIGPVENAAAFLERDGRPVVQHRRPRAVGRQKTVSSTSGRKDRMVKRRGYRIELGEIERALYLEPRVPRPPSWPCPILKAASRSSRSCRAEAAPPRRSSS